MNSKRNVFPNYEQGAKRLSKLGLYGGNVFLIRGRNVFPKYEEGAKRPP